IRPERGVARSASRVTIAGMTSVAEGVEPTDMTSPFPEAGVDVDSAAAHTSSDPTRPTDESLDSSPYGFHDPDDEGLEPAERAALRRVAGLATELEDVTEVEYRQLRLERVVLVGVWTSGTVQDAENSLAELAALAETAGALVLEGIIQRRDKPDPATYIGSGKAYELRDIVLETGADTV